jgi:thiamine transport system substrate-binding protein
MNQIAVKTGRRSSRLAKSLALIAAGALALAGCSASPQATEPAATQPSAGESGAAEPTTVRLAAHDSFAISDELIAEFEAASGLKLEILRLGDTGSLTNQLILTSDNPVADAVFGIDNTFAGLAEDNGIIAGELVAIDFSDVCFNYDLDWFSAAGIEPPTSWRELGDERYRDLTVVTNPRLSSPGLAFLATTHAGFDTDAEVFAYWRGIRDNGLKVAGGWEDAYFTDFTRYGGSRPIVLSYASSPSAEVSADGTPGTAALLDECFRQTEFAGVLKNAAAPTGAQKLIEFLLAPSFQAAVPELMYVYPADTSIELPESWAQFAIPARSTIGENLDINGNRERWLKDWSDVFVP